MAPLFSSARFRSPKWIVLFALFFAVAHILVTHSDDFHHLRENWRGSSWNLSGSSEDSESLAYEEWEKGVLGLGPKQGLCQGSNLSNNTYRCLGLQSPKLPTLPLPSDRFTTNNNNHNNKVDPSNQFISSLARLSYTPLPKSCIDSHFADGEPCSAFSPSHAQGGSGQDGSTVSTPSNGSQASAPALAGGRGLDVVWIWANGSDPLFQDAIYEAELARLGQEAVNAKINLAKTKLYRDHDELRYSIRSVLQHFIGQTTKLHIVTPDLGDATGRRYGILPQWLNFRDISPDSLDTPNSPGSSNNDDSSASNSADRIDSSKSSKIPTTPWKDSGVELNIMHHSQIFENLDNATFNSFSIESQLRGLTTASDPYVYMNDDFFFTRNLATSDFYSSPYGIVLRLDPTLSVVPDEWPTDSPAGEWQPLKYSNWLLSNRFGRRTRPYMVHVAKTISPMILREMQSTWPEEFTTTEAHSFRGQRDVYTTFIHGHFIVERWRELLLWSWVVGKIGNDDDSWTDEQHAVAWEELGGVTLGDNTYPSKEAYVYMRFTLEKQRIRNHLNNAGEPFPAATDYIFSNLDGYPYSLLIGARDWPRIAEGNDAPNADFRQHLWSRCKLDHELCFPKGKTASEMFEHVAFTEPRQCGDCIITALIQRSGRLGLNAFLPPKHRIKYHSSKGRVVQEVDPLSNPTLPLTKTPQEASFALKDVLAPWGTVGVRDWILRAMERYRFVISHTPADFAMLTGPRGAERLFRKVDTDDNIALLTINDDVTMMEQEVDRIFRAFLNRRWGFPSAWEA